MRVAIISDIHGNLPALEAVLAAIADEHPDELWCLGDIVGYGADPDACADLIREQADVCLAGNHDLVVIGTIDIGAFASGAAVAARWTAAAISERTRRFLAELEPSAEREGIGLFHASPRNPVWEYVLSAEQALVSLERQPQRICLIGHSHVASFFALEADSITAEQATAGMTVDLGSGKWLVNPGSVGQPRDGDPRAAFALLDTESEQALYRRVEYPVDRAAAAILDAGLPPQLAERLFVGQ